MAVELKKYGHIFVGGAPRSGTTLVQRILGAHSLVYAGPEFDLVPEIVKLRSQFLQKIDVGRISAYLDKDTVNALFGGFLVSVFQKKINETGKAYLSEKTPSNIEVFPELLECLPQAQYIFIVRDPRAIVASMLEVGRKYRKDLKVPPLFTRSTRHAVAYINQLWAKGNEARLKSGNVLVMHYEDIISNPRGAIEGMTRFLALPFEEGLLNIQESDWEMPAFKAGEAYWYTKEQLKDAIRKDAVEKWPNILTKYDLYVINKWLQRISGLTDRYQLETDSSIRWALNDFVGTNVSNLMRFSMRAAAKLYRILWRLVLAAG
jgi:hypothetical protein